jgi:Calcineurin-like phosphoesterase
MRIVFTSDLHADLGGSNAAIIPHLVQRAAEVRPDVLLVAGDVADRAEAVERTLAAFRGVAPLCLYVPGNHDLYAEIGPGRITDSRAKFERVLPRVARATGFEYLGLGPIHWRGLTVVGTPGWWDFTLRDPELDACVSLGQYRSGIWRTQRAFDRGQVLWPRGDPAVQQTQPAAAQGGWSQAARPTVTPHASPPGSQPASLASDWAGDEEICDHMLDLLDRQLHEAPRAAPVLAAVHVLPCLEAVQRHAFGPSSFHDATLGSVRFGERLRADGRVRAVVTGHLHRPVDARLGSIPVVSRPVGRLRDPGIDLAASSAACLGVLEID